MKYLVVLTLLISFQARASFDENARRYLSAQDLINTLSMYFPMDSNYTDSVCKTVTDKNSATLGLSSPLTGNPIAPGPTQATVQWIIDCVSRAVTGYQESQYSKKLAQLIGNEAMEKMAPNPIGLYALWNQWPEDLRERVIAQVMLTLLGSDDVIRDFGLIEPDVLRAKLKAWTEQHSQLTILDAIRFLSVNLALRDEFLSY